MTTLIDRIIKKIGESPREDYRPDKEKQLRQILEAELTAVKGVDEIIEIYKGEKVEDIRGKSVLCKDSDGYFIGNLLGNILPHRGLKEPFFISDLKALKQTPVNDSQPKEDKPIYNAKDPESNRKHIIEDMC